MYLETERLWIRPILETDFADYCAYSLGNPEQDRMMGRSELKTKADVRQNFDWLKDKEPRAYVLVHKKNGKVIGNLTVYDRTPVAHMDELRDNIGRSLSFCLSRQYRRQGLMEEALRGVIGKLFAEEAVDYIHCGCFDFNTPSLALQKKLGFVFLAKEAFEIDGIPYVGIENILRKFQE